jgi:hypothetical protein
LLPAKKPSWRSRSATNHAPFPVDPSSGDLWRQISQKSIPPMEPSGRKGVPTSCLVVRTQLWLQQIVISLDLTFRSGFYAAICCLG